MKCYVFAKPTPDLPRVVEQVENYSVVKFVEKLIDKGYLLVIVESEEIRYTINQKRQCSCITDLIKTKKCATCKSNIHIEKITNSTFF